MDASPFVRERRTKPLTERCDALIVGGGPAGSSCAWALRRAGMKVHVLDRCVFPRDKTCAGWITPEVLSLLEIDPADYRHGRVIQEIMGFKVGLLGGPLMETTYSRPVSFSIRRCEFDHYLLERSGARCHLGVPLHSLTRSGDGWRVNEQYQTPLIIGAGGHFCPVARSLGAKIGAETIVAAQEVEFELDLAQQRACTVRPEVPELFFCEDLQGYGWCVRKQGYLNVGMGREDPNQLSDHIQRFIHMLKGHGKIPLDTPHRLHGHAYILYGHTRRKLLDHGVVLIGDAAGLAHPYSGEGIRAAVEAGLLAAEVIRNANGNYHVDRLRPYADALIERFGRPGRGENWLAFLPASLKRFAAGSLFATHWFTRRVVLERWFLGVSPCRRGLPAPAIVSAPDT